MYQKKSKKLFRFAHEILQIYLGIVVCQVCELRTTKFPDKLSNKRVNFPLEWGYSVNVRSVRNAELWTCLVFGWEKVLAFCFFYLSQLMSTCIFSISHTWHTSKMFCARRVRAVSIKNSRTFDHCDPPCTLRTPYLLFFLILKQKYVLEKK